MRDAVRAVFRGFTTTFEGDCSWMYLDCKCLVTTGVGNLIDPISAAMALPWVLRWTGEPATRSQIAAEWARVKSRTDLAPHGGGAFEIGSVLRLLPAAVDALVAARLASNEFYLAQRVPHYGEMPADAQLAVHSMAWSEGPGFIGMYPKMRAHLEDQDYIGAAGECTISEVGNRGVRPRNVANRLCLYNADRVQAEHRDPDVLIWPAALVEDPVDVA